MIDARAGRGPHARRAQGSSEYAVILGAMLLIALIAIGALYILPNIPQGARTSTSDAYWGSATPLAINGHMVTTDGELTLIVVNQGSKAVRLSEIQVNGADMDGQNDSSVNLASGRQIERKIALGHPCQPDESYELYVNFTYGDADAQLPGQIQIGKEPIIGRCNGPNAPAAPNCGGLTCSGDPCNDSDECQTHNCQDFGDEKICMECTGNGHCNDGERCINGVCQAVEECPNENVETYSQLGVDQTYQTSLTTQCEDTCCDNSPPYDTACLYNACQGENSTWSEGCNTVCNTSTNATCTTTCTCSGGGTCACSCRPTVVIFNITQGQIVSSECYNADITVLGASITYGEGGYNIPVTVRLKLGNQSVDPWGSFTTPVTSNVNDGNNPRVYHTQNLTASSKISITARSWQKVCNQNQNSCWATLYTRDSHTDPTWVWVLRDGDSVPNVTAFGNQSTIEYYLQDYIVDDHIVLGGNQAIFLFELGTNDPNSPAADYQDLVILANMNDVFCPGQNDSCDCSCTCEYEAQEPACSVGTLCCPANQTCLTGMAGVGDPFDSMVWQCCTPSYSCGKLPSPSVASQEYLCCPLERKCNVPASVGEQAYTCCPEGTVCLGGNSCVPG